MNNPYTYYGHYISNDPAIESYCNLPALEIPEPDINILQSLVFEWCTQVTLNAAYLVVELDNTCIVH